MKAFESMTLEALIAMRAKLDAEIAVRVEQERKRLAASLETLETIAAQSPAGGRMVASQVKRKIPPKYRNPDNPQETWAGRGLKPRWLVAALKGGKRRLSDFAIGEGR